MATDAEADRYAAIAIELACRVRDDDPEANARWLATQVHGEDDLRALVFTLAAAIPQDRTWFQLTAWTHMLPGFPDSPAAIEERRRVLDDALRPGRRAA